MAIRPCLFNIGAGHDASSGARDALLASEGRGRPGEPLQAMAQQMWSIHSSEGPDMCPISSCQWARRDFQSELTPIVSGPHAVPEKKEGPGGGALRCDASRPNDVGCCGAPSTPRQGV